MLIVLKEASLKLAVTAVTVAIVESKLFELASML